MTPEERAETLENIKRAVAESPKSIFGIGQYEFEASDITAAIREAEQAVHAQYAEVLKAADELVVGLGTYALTRVIHRPFEVVLGKAESYRAARANLKGK